VNVLSLFKAHISAVRPMVHTSSLPRNDICSLSFQYFREHLWHFIREVRLTLCQQQPKIFETARSKMRRSAGKMSMKISLTIIKPRGMWQRRWLRHCATICKNIGSVPDEDI
jgi:hypothetical protein